jgi:hypothetical protein
VQQDATIQYYGILIFSPVIRMGTVVVVVAAALFGIAYN